MPDYGQPIENDLNFNSLLDFFRAKGKKKDKAPDVKIPMGPRGPKTMRGLPKGDETQEFVDVDKDDDMGGKKGGVAGSGKGGQGGWPKKQNYGNPKPTPITPAPKKKSVNKGEDLEKVDVPGAIKGGIRGLRGQRHPLTGTRHERDLRSGDYGDEMRGEDVGRGIRNLPPRISERVGSEFNPELLEDTARAAGRVAGRAGRGGYEVARRVGEAEREAFGGAKEGFALRRDPRGTINPPIGRHPAQSRAQNVGERVGYGISRAPYAVDEAAQRFFQPESAYNPPDRPGIMDARARQSWRGRQASQDIARDPARTGKGPMELAVEKALLKLMKEDKPRFRASVRPPEHMGSSEEPITYKPLPDPETGEAAGSPAEANDLPIYEPPRPKGKLKYPSGYSIEDTLLKLMKGGDEQQLNPMEDPPKENKESQALVADGDSKRPKSEVGTNETLFKLMKYGDILIKKAKEDEQLPLPGMEPPEGETPASKFEEPGHLEPSKQSPKQRMADLAKKIQAELARRRGETPDGPVEKAAGLLATAARAAAPAIGQAVGEKVGSKIKGEGVEQINKVMEHPEDRPRKSIRYLMPSKRLQQLRQGDTDGPAGSKRVAPGEEASDRAVTSESVFNATPHTVPEDLPVKVRNSVKNSLLKLMKEEESKAPKRGRPPIEPMPEVPGNEGIRSTPMSSHGYGVDSGGEATGLKVPSTTPFTVTDKPLDLGEHAANQRKLEDMWEAVQSGKVKLNMQEHADFAARMQRWGRDEQFAREAGLKHHPAVAHIAENRALRNSSPVEKSLLKLMKADEDDVEKMHLEGTKVPHSDEAMDGYMKNHYAGGKDTPVNHFRALNNLANGKYVVEPRTHEDSTPFHKIPDMTFPEFQDEFLTDDEGGPQAGNHGYSYEQSMPERPSAKPNLLNPELQGPGGNVHRYGRLNSQEGRGGAMRSSDAQIHSQVMSQEHNQNHFFESHQTLAQSHGSDIPKSDVENSILKIMKTEEPRSRQAMEAEFPVRHPDDTIDPTIRVSSRTGIDAPVRPDPSQAETYPEQLQSEAESKRDRRTRGGRESGAMGVRDKPIPDYRPGRSHMTGGAMESRKVPIGHSADMEKGGTFWGGSRKQDIRQNKPMARQGTPWSQQQNEPSQTAGVGRRIQGFRQKPPRMGNLGEVRGQRKKSVEKAHLEGQGISDQSEGFDLSKPLPKAKVTGVDHPEGPGKRLINGFTTKERNKMKKDDAGLNLPTYPQDADATPSYPMAPKVRKRPSRARHAEEARRMDKKPIEESLLKLMKEGELIPSKVGMTRKNAARDLDKAGGAQAAMASMAAPKAAPPSAFQESGAQEAQGMDSGVDVGRMMQYGAYQQAGGVADRLMGIKHEDDPRATGAGIAAGGLKAGAKGIGTVASGIGNVFGRGKKNGTTPPDPTDTPDPTTNYQP